MNLINQIIRTQKSASNKKTRSGSNSTGAVRFLTLFLSVLVFSCGYGYSAAIIAELDLTGRIQSEGGTLDGENGHGYGAYGMYLGNDFNSYLTHGYTNWEWDDLRMEIYDDGDANISGTMTRQYDNSSWGVNIDLFDLEIDGAFAGGATTAYSDIVADLLASEEDGAGLEWDSLSMQLTSPYSTAVPLTGWTGLAMPGSPYYHDNVAELHYDTGRGLSFEAWYEHSTNPNFYKVGDTKTNAFLLPSSPSAPVPEPSEWALIGIAMLAIILRNKKRLVLAKEAA